MLEFIKYIAKTLKDIAAFFGLELGDTLTIFGILGGGVFAIYKGVRWFLTRQKNLKLSKELIEFGTYLDIKEHTRFYVPTKVQNISPTNEMDPRSPHAFVTKNLAMPFFLYKAFNTKKEVHRFYLLLADTGMGKTTFMINLYQQYVSQWWGKEYKIKLLPLGDPYIDEKIDDIPKSEHKQTILLLDAFDEDQKALQDYQARLTQIIKMVRNFRVIVITCRTQFFVSEEAQPQGTGLLKFAGKSNQEYIFQRLYISFFEDKDIRSYLRRKFSIWQREKRKKAFELVNQAPDLMVRPMLLSHIEYLLDDGKQYEATFQIYETLIDKWIEREVNKRRGQEKLIRDNQDDQEQLSYREQLELFTKSMAVYIYETSLEKNGLFVGPEEIQELVKKYPEIKLLEIQMRSHSLLNNDALGNYKFAHKSILEYLLGKKCAEEPKFAKNFSFKGMDFAQKIYQEFILLELVPSLQVDSGEFWLEGDKVPRSLSQINVKNIQDIVRLKIKDVTEFEIEKLWVFPKLRDLTLTYKHPLLYFLYVIYLVDWLELHKLPKWLEVPELLERLKLLERQELRERGELHKLPERLELPELPKLRELQELLKLLELRGLPELNELLKQLELYKQGKPYKREKLIALNERLELLERHKRLGWHELLKLLEGLERLYKLREQSMVKGEEEEIINELKALNEYIKEVQALQKEMPHCKIYY